VQLGLVGLSRMGAVHAELLAQAGIGYLDCGVSGGVWGRHNGYGLMVGGAAEHVERLMPVFDVLRPEGPRDVADSGEGRWTVEESINHAVPAPVISAALFARFASRQPDSPAMRAVAALRQQFGGHAVQQASPIPPSD
jgi:6-phosphogluconate dehydrogenase (decarboxylating)